MTAAWSSEDGHRQVVVMVMVNTFADHDAPVSYRTPFDAPRDTGRLPGAHLSS